MPWPLDRQRPKSRFGSVFRGHMERINITTGGLAHRLELNGTLFSPTVIAHYMAEGRSIRPSLVNKFATALELTKEQREELHQAAALDYGYEIGEE